MDTGDCTRSLRDWGMEKVHYRWGPGVPRGCELEKRSKNSDKCNAKRSKNRQKCNA